MKKYVGGLFIALLTICANAQSGHPWPVEKANEWYNQHKWLTGSNYIPSNAINQLEMWQAETFSPDLIDKEFTLAEGIGFNTMRVFLHSLAWKQDPQGFKKRMSTFLDIAQKHGIQPMFVFFDDCWDKDPKPGKQRDPKPGVHNSGWVKDPGDPACTDTGNFPELKKYVMDILADFGHDKRVLAWDLYNEPSLSLPLLKAVFAWARAANPDQPITSCIDNVTLIEFNTFKVANSDIITYHCYGDAKDQINMIQLLKIIGRPLICTEYMARTINSTFANTLPLLKNEHVGAINWGFVEGKTNTIYAWGTPIPDGSQPDVWFHDIFRKDFTPYRRDETDLIKKLNADDGGGRSSL
jgi:hypothetical protein